jgi:hypothetical protein
MRSTALVFATDDVARAEVSLEEPGRAHGPDGSDSWIERAATLERALAVCIVRCVRISHVV